MNTNKLTIAAAVTAIAVALSVAIAPALFTQAEAKKTVTPPTCEVDPQEREECPGESGGRNPNREQIECSVTGGGGDPVPGQQKKVCGTD